MVKTQGASFHLQLQSKERTIHVQLLKTSLPSHYNHEILGDSEKTTNYCLMNLINCILCNIDVYYSTCDKLAKCGLLGCAELCVSALVYRNGILICSFRFLVKANFIIVLKYALSWEDFRKPSLPLFIMK